MMGGTYLEVIGCLEVALVDLLGGVMDLNTADGFGMVLETGLTLVLVNVKGLVGAGALREPIDSNRSFPVMSTLSIVLAAVEFFRHMLDFRSSVLLWICVANLWLGYLYDLICHEFCELFGCESLICFVLQESVLAYSCSICFLADNHMLPKCLFFVFQTPFV